MADYYYTQGSERQGPIALAELQALAQAGQVAGADYYWTAGMADWLKVGESELFQTAASAPSPTSEAEPSNESSTAPSAEWAGTMPAPETASPVAPTWDAEPAPVPAVTAADQPPAVTTPAAAWSPAPAANQMVNPAGGSVQRVAAKMPKPIWLLVLGVMTVLFSVISMIGIFTIPFSLVGIWAGVKLFNANSALENARQTGSVESLEKAASSLNTYFAIYGIGAIVYILFFIAILALGLGSDLFSNF